MKLRVKGNSLRLRLSQSEVAAVGRGDGVVEQTTFPGGRSLVYRLSVAGIDRLAASYRDGSVEITVPSAVAAEWAETSMVSLTGEETLADGQALKLLVEKDFECIDPKAGEDYSDAFPNPEASR